jgi:hypothetical protein
MMMKNNYKGQTSSLAQPLNVFKYSLRLKLMSFMLYQTLVELTGKTIFHWIVKPKNSLMS